MLLAVPYTLLVMLTTTPAARIPGAAGQLSGGAAFQCAARSPRCMTLDFGKLAGYVYFSGVIIFCFYSLIHLKRMLAVRQSTATTPSTSSC